MNKALLFIMVLVLFACKSKRIQEQIDKNQELIYANREKIEEAKQDIENEKRYPPNLRGKMTPLYQQIILNLSRINDSLKIVNSRLNQELKAIEAE